jgi:hypothetical protein
MLMAAAGTVCLLMVAVTSVRIGRRRRPGVLLITGGVGLTPTAAFVMAGEGASWIAGIPGYEGCAVTADRGPVWTEGCRRMRVQDIGT